MQNLIHNVITDSLKLGIHLYKEQLEKSPVYRAIELNCAEIYDTDEPNSKMHPSFFGWLHGMFEDDSEINRRACLYIMEILSPSTAEVEQAFRAFKLSGSNRNSSAIKKHTDPSTKFLYIGKVKSNIGARMTSHMGFGNTGTGALQLGHWAKTIDLKLCVHVYAFDRELDDFINPLELTVTKGLRPLIGKSK